MPLRRDLRFRLDPARINDWASKGPYVTQFMNSLSIFFPEGERFFINAVRHYRSQITDPTLQEAVTGFIGQEAMHGREHTDFNRLMTEAGLPAAELEARVTRVLARVTRHTSPARRLSATIALEHITAILADFLLSHRETFAASEPRYEKLWHWHALEETEHKAVAFDVWCAVMPRDLRSYLLRVGGLVVATALFAYLVRGFLGQMIAAAPPVAERGAARRQLRDFLWGRKPGVLPGVARAWLDYFKPGFHPWQHDNRGFLSEIDAIEGELRVA